MAKPARNRSGFTLIELLVAMVIGGLLTGVIFQFLQGQGRYVAVQSAREEVQQNARASVELIGSELRSLPPLGGLEKAFADSLTIRVPRVWGVVCAPVSSGATSVDVAIPALAGVTYPANNGTALAVNVGDSTSDPDWTPAVKVSGIGSADPNCNGAPLPNNDPGTMERRTLTVSATPQGSTSSTPLPQVGDVMYFFDQVTYRTDRSTVGSAADSVWLYRRLGDYPQPLAGPLWASNGERGLEFAYYTSGASEPVSVPSSGLDATTLNQVNRIRMVVHTISRRQATDAQQSQTDTVFISLRNRM
jgi:prepilin-type N-terminal cleavage/methylation domain-containing protein